MLIVINKTVDLDLTEEEKNFFVRAAKEIFEENHFAYWELPLVIGGKREELEIR